LQAIKQRAEDSPAHAAWLKNYQQQSLDARAAQDEQPIANPPSAVTAGPPTDKTPTIASQIGKSVSKWYEETPAPLMVAEGAGGLAALELGRRAIANIVPTPGERVQRQQNELRQQELELQRQKLATGTTLSPYEQARAETEKLRAQQIQQQIELEAKQFELSKIKAEQAQAAAQERAAAKLQIKDPVEQRLAEISKSQGYEGNIAPAGNVVPQINPMQPQPAPPPEVKPAPVPPTATTPTPVTPAPVETAPVVTAPVAEAPARAAVPPKKAPKEKLPMPEGWGKGMSWLTTVHGIEGAQAFIDQYNNGKPFASHKEMEDVYKNVTMRPKYSDIPKSVRQERAIIPRASLPNLPLSAVPPPSLQATPQLGGGGGALVRGLTDPLQLKQ